MATFNVTALADLGYDNVQGLDDPDDTRFVAEDWSAEAYSDEAVQGRLSWLGSLGAYNEREQVASAVAAYYTGPNPPVETGNSQAATATGAQWGGNNGGSSHGNAPSHTQNGGQNSQNHGGWGTQKGGRQWQS